MIVRCAPDTVKDFIAASSVQSEQVQKVLCASRNVLTARLPLARRACNDSGFGRILLSLDL